MPSGYDDTSKEVYDAALGDFYEAYQKVDDASSLSERYALDALAEAKQRDLSDSFVLSGTSAKFSITFDLAWKVMKDILVEYYAMTGFIAGSPHEVLKTSYKAELISDDTWIEMLKGGRLKPFYHISISVDQKLRKVPLDIGGVTEIRLGAV